MTYTPGERQAIAERPPKLIIGLSGRKGSGKSSVADQLRLALISMEIPSSVVSFATPMRLMMEELLAYSGVVNPASYLRDPKLKEQDLHALGGKSVRYLMQTLGTEWGRDCVAEDLWVTLGINKALFNECPVVIIDDVRFPNEAEAIQNTGGWVFHIKRPQAEHGDVDAHPSEAHSLGQWVFNGTDNPGDAAKIVLALLEGPMIRLLEQME